MKTTLRQLNAEADQRLKAAAKTIPADVMEGIKIRAVEAVASGEPHKPTGGWVILPFLGQGHNILGLLEATREALRAAQSAAA